MSTLVPSSLDSSALALRLRELAGEERNVQVDFLLHLDEFDRRRAFVEAGHPSLWSYCLEVLHLREGSAGRRIQAMKVLRRFPTLESALRDGRLCLSTAVLLGQVLTEENLDDLLARAAYRTRAEVDHLVASVQARTAPRAGIRKLPEREPARASVPLPLAPGLDEPAAEAAADTAPPSAADPVTMPLAGSRAADGPREPAGERARRASELRAVTGSQWSLRVTIDRACKEDLDTLTSLLAHKIPDGDLAAVLHEAIRCAVENHGKRRGAVAPAKKVSRKTPDAARRVEPATTIPAAVRREVWARDGGCCAYVAPDGRRCNSRWKLELDHIHPAALGGTPTADNLRLACRAHNLLHAERTYGREHMDHFRRRTNAEAPRPRNGAPPGPAVQSVLWGT
jgi:5-methylcytosine-specific restriction endonuclease McrA